ncbi:hypothetical protein CLIM01_05012 [Colletotrichum limetticola]|uniref:Uncharacterized protein n=1 Tax=Colletotrichum limetticola TaxID=1209924 RepID=A0ABQ9Q1F7_9PEZI|nr:hypothetical protein CLIM01_05012 [Colletotrichum limetticola]
MGTSNDSRITLSAEATDKRCYQQICEYNLDTFKTFPLDTHPEINQFSKIIQDIHSDYCARALDSVLATAAKLSLISL